MKEVDSRQGPVLIATGRDTMPIWKAAKILRLLQLQAGSNSGWGIDQVDGEWRGKFAVNLSPLMAEG